MKSISCPLLTSGVIGFVAKGNFYCEECYENHENCFPPFDVIITQEDLRNYVYECDKCHKKFW